MTKFVENLNAYLSQLKIKQTYVSMKTGIDSKKLSRILTGKQEATLTDVEKLAAALGKSVEFFLGDNVDVPDISSLGLEKVAFYAGNPTREQQHVAEQLVELIENIDLVVSAKRRFVNISKE